MSPHVSHRLTNREIMRSRRERRRKGGLCLDCGKSSPKAYHTLCQSCLLSRATSEAARRLRLKAGAQ